MTKEMLIYPYFMFFYVNLAEMYILTLKFYFDNLSLILTFIFNTNLYIIIND